MSGWVRKIRSLAGAVKRWLIATTMRSIPMFRPFDETRDHNNPITFGMWFLQKVVGFNRQVYWPVHFTSVVTGYKNIVIGIDTSPGFAHGCYIQATGEGKITIGDYTGIGPNVGIVSSGHSLTDFRKHEYNSVVIGKYCWIGMNSVILPKVTLGDFTVVRAGSVVNTSFPDGYCVIGGNPAVLIKKFPPEAAHLFNRYQHKKRYVGYIKADDFPEYRRRHLNV